MVEIKRGKCFIVVQVMNGLRRNKSIFKNKCWYQKNIGEHQL